MLFRSVQPDIATNIAAIGSHESYIASLSLIEIDLARQARAVAGGISGLTKIIDPHLTHQNVNTVRNRITSKDHRLAGFNTFHMAVDAAWSKVIMTEAKFVTEVSEEPRLQRFMGVNVDKASAGTFKAIIGVFAMLYVRERRLWIWLQSDGQGGTRISAALSTTRKTLDADQVSWVAGEPPAEGPVSAKTRYRQADMACVHQGLSGGRFSLQFKQAQWAVTPGQSAVVYDGDICLGGGIIASAGKPPA